MVVLAAGLLEVLESGKLLLSAFGMNVPEGCPARALAIDVDLHLESLRWSPDWAGSITGVWMFTGLEMETVNVELVNSIYIYIYMYIIIYLYIYTYTSNMFKVCADFIGIVLLIRFLDRQFSPGCYWMALRKPIQLQLPQGRSGSWKFGRCPFLWRRANLSIYLASYLSIYRSIYLSS